MQIVMNVVLNGEIQIINFYVGNMRLLIQQIIQVTEMIMNIKIFMKNSLILILLNLLSINIMKYVFIFI